MVKPCWSNLPSGSAGPPCQRQPGVLFVKLTMPHLANDETGRTTERRQQTTFPANSSGGDHAVTQFRHFNEVGFKSIFKTGAPKSLGQVGLACAESSHKGEVFVGIDGGQCRKAVQSLHISADDPDEIKVIKDLCHGKPFHISQVVLSYHHCKFLGREAVLCQFTAGLFWERILVGAEAIVVTPGHFSGWQPGG